MSTIKNIKELRGRVLKAFDDLEKGKIDIAEAASIAKMSETVISGLKSEMQYCVLTNQKPDIDFYGKQSGIPLDDTRVKKLL